MPAQAVTSRDSDRIAASPHPAPAGGGHSQRVIFIDLARALAVVFMLYGHAVSALLAPEYQVGTWFDVWQFQRGLTSSLFLLLSGFAFSIATGRRWAQQIRLSPAVFRRIRRFMLFIVLGYALHFPVGRFVLLASASEARWESFLAVDVLQLIGVAFIAVQLLVFVTRTRAAFTVAAFVGALVVLLMTPWVWSAGAHSVSPALRAYLVPSTGSLFPLFPFAAFVLVGAGLGQLYAQSGADRIRSYVVAALLVPGAAAVAIAVLAGPLPPTLFGQGPWNAIPSQIVLRIGSCLIVLAAIAFASQRIAGLPHVFGAVAQETLLIYFVHLCIVYGSVWNRGLAQSYGLRLGPWETLLVVIVLITAMVGLAWFWNWFKHSWPRVARGVSFAAGALLLYRLM